MIQTKSREIIELIDSKQKAKSDQEHLNFYITREKQLRELVERLRPKIGMLLLFDKKGVSLTDHSIEISDLLQVVEQVKEQFETNPEWVMEQRALQDVQRKLNGVEKKLQTSLENAWKSYVNLCMPPISEDILIPLESISSFRHKVQIIRESLQEMKGRIDILPKSEQEFDELEFKKRTVMAAWTSMDAEDVPDEVLYFLRQTGDKGASLDLLTDTIKEWLSKHGISSLFSIRITN